MAATTTPRRSPLRGAAATAAGRRPENEDTVDLHVAADGLFAIVADGMGGGIDGKRFSEQAVAILRTELVSAGAHNRAALDQGVATVAAAIRELRRSNPAYTISGTTLVAVVLRKTPDGAEGALASIGDSRAYLVQTTGSARQLTRDHTYAEQLISEGADRAEAYKHKQALRLTHALGDELELEQVPNLFSDLRLRPGEQLVLCTDGVAKHLTGEQLASLARGAEPGAAAEAILRAATAAGSKDNVSAVVISLATRRRGAFLATALSGLVAVALAGGAWHALAGAAARPLENTELVGNATVTPLPSSTAAMVTTSTPALGAGPTSTLAPSVTSTPSPTSSSTATPRPTSTRRPIIATSTAAPTAIPTTSMVATLESTPDFTDPPPEATAAPTATLEVTLEPSSPTLDATAPAAPMASPEPLIEVPPEPPPDAPLPAETPIPGTP